MRTHSPDLEISHHSRGEYIENLYEQNYTVEFNILIKDILIIKLISFEILVRQKILHKE